MNPDSLNFYTATGLQPKKNAINLLEEVDLPLVTDEIKAVVKDGKTYLSFPLD